MKPVKQTDTSPTDGNCFAACVASLLEQDLESVPNFCAEKEWVKLFDEYLAVRGMFHVTVRLKASDKPVLYPMSADGLVILSGPSPRGEFLHSIIARFDTAENNFVMVHDPHPDGSGLAGPAEDVIFLVALRPALLVAIEHDIWQEQHCPECGGTMRDAKFGCRACYGTGTLAGYDAEQKRRTAPGVFPL
jgi:hypothetical protein